MTAQREAAKQPAPAGKAPVPHSTRQMTRGPLERPEPRRRPERQQGPGDYEFDPLSGKFGGIELSEFVWARQHGRRMVLMWLAIVMAITGLVATAGWTIGTNLSGLL
jgi:serine/threonine-protein kinase